DATEELGRGERAPVVAVVADFAVLDGDHGDVRQLVRLARGHDDPGDGELGDDHRRVGGLVHGLRRHLADVQEVRVVAQVFADRGPPFDALRVAGSGEREFEDAVLGPQPGEPGHVVLEQQVDPLLDEVSWVHQSSFDVWTGRYRPDVSIDGTVPSRPPARLLAWHA